MAFCVELLSSKSFALRFSNHVNNFGLMLDQQEKTHE